MRTDEKICMLKQLRKNGLLWKGNEETRARAMSFSVRLGPRRSIHVRNLGRGIYQAAWCAAVESLAVLGRALQDAVTEAVVEQNKRRAREEGRLVNRPFLCLQEVVS